MLLKYTRADYASNKRANRQLKWLFPRDGNNKRGACFQNITERRLNWYGHVMRRDGEHILRKVLRADIPGKGREDDRKQDGKTHVNEI